MPVAYKGKSRRIRDALASVLATVTYDPLGNGNNEPAFGIVTTDPAAEFSAEPFGLVLPGPIDNVMATNSQNDRSVHFSLIVELALEKPDIRTQAQTYTYMEDLTDILMDTLDEADFTDLLNTYDNSLGVWLMSTTRGRFVPMDSKEGALLLCTIDVAVSYSKNL